LFCFVFFFVAIIACLCTRFHQITSDFAHHKKGQKEKEKKKKRKRKEKEKKKKKKRKKKKHSKPGEERDKNSDIAHPDRVPLAQGKKYR
jgi:hypothetical protein